MTPMRHFEINWPLRGSRKKTSEKISLFLLWPHGRRFVSLSKILEYERTLLLLLCTSYSSCVAKQNSLIICPQKIMKSYYLQNYKKTPLRAKKTFKYQTTLKSFWHVSLLSIATNELLTTYSTRSLLANYIHIFATFLRFRYVCTWRSCQVGDCRMRNVFVTLENHPNFSPRLRLELLRIKP